MNYSGIIYDDIANGIGIRTSLFVSGCRNNCRGCFNKEQQEFNYGKLFTKEVAEDILNSVNDDYHAGITILGGDPMEPENAEVLYPFVKEFKERFPKKSLWIYTGYMWDNIISLSDTDPRKMILKYTDILVDGPFVEHLKNLALEFRGSANQRLIVVQKTLETDVSEPILLNI